MQDDEVVHDNEFGGMRAEAVERAQDYVLRCRSDSGWWLWPQESNVTMDSEDLFLRHIFGVLEPSSSNSSARFLRERQRADGTWATFAGGPGDVSVTVEAYVALRLAGDAADLDHMRAAAAWVRSVGGLGSVRVFTRFWLAMLGLLSWEQVPALPPEIILFPRWMPLNVYDWASWARTVIVPLTVVSTMRPVWPVPFTTFELGDAVPSTAARSGVAARMFAVLDHVLRRYHRVPARFKPLCPRALRAATRWILAHQEADGSWGGLQPPHIYSLIALRLVGLPLDHPAITAGLRGLDDYVVDEELPTGPARRLQVCRGPIWDTALAVHSLLDSGFTADHPAVTGAVKWLLDNEITRAGDWAQRRPGLAAGGWSFEFANVNYPDLDDTAEVVRVLTRVRSARPGQVPGLDEAVRRGVEWVVGMRSADGGWGAFDADNTSRVPRTLPFCDFGEVTDPPSADVTAHVVEMLAAQGPRYREVVNGGVAWLLRHQEPDGSWFGRWGVNHVYGVGAVVPALVAAGVPSDHEAIRRAVKWLWQHQNDDGGWGEDARSYDDPAWIGKGASTPSQTGWALLALAAASECSSPMYRGMHWLVDHQRLDGGWDEHTFTGTGFPGDFYINYHSYRVVFSLSALGVCAAAVTSSRVG